jgi:hypothetical protein
MQVPEKGRRSPLSFHTRRSLPRKLCFRSGGTMRAKRSISRKLKEVCGPKTRSPGYEKVSFRLNRSCGSPFTVQPECPGALGLLSLRSSLLSWLPLCLLASPLLASRLLVWRILVSGLLGLVSWPSHGRGGTVLTGLDLMNVTPLARSSGR